MKIITNRKVINLTNLPTKTAVADYGSLVRGDYHYFGDEIAEKIIAKYDDGGGDSISRRPATEDEKNAMYGTGKSKKEKTGFFSKGSRDARKDNRISERDERRANRKAKYGARPLNPTSKGGKQFWKDHLPHLKKKADGNYEKTLPNGDKQDIQKEQVQIIMPPANSKSVEPIAVDKKDLNTPQEVVTQVVGNTLQVSKNYVESQVEKVVDGGAETVYKKADVVNEGSPEAKKPMSKTTIALLIGGGVLVLVAGYFVYKKMKK
jgi:hypothetical protein